MKLLLFNTRTKLIGETDISKGTVNAALVSPRELFIEALQKNAVSIILLHNHPSGDPTPSKEDILLTRKVRDAGNLIGIDLLDHIILGDNTYIENCIVESRDTIRANTRHIGENGVKVVVEKNERYAL